MPEKCSGDTRIRAPGGGGIEPDLSDPSPQIAHECAHTGATPTHPWTLLLSLSLLLML